MTETDESIRFDSLPKSIEALQTASDQQKQEDRISVVVRCRPSLQNELANKGNYVNQNVVRITDNVLFLDDPYEGIDSKIERRREERMYLFDRCFDQNSSNLDIFEQSVVPLVDTVFEGFNATCFSYGMTGAGKTYTMMGHLLPTVPASVKGVYTLVSEYIFHRIIADSSSRSFEVKVNFLEIYNETIKDLLRSDDLERMHDEPSDSHDDSVQNSIAKQTLELNVASSPLRTAQTEGEGENAEEGHDPMANKQQSSGQILSLREDPEKGMIVVGLTELNVSTVEEIEQLILAGNKRRAMASTDRNVVSSRSHAILQISITSHDRDEDGGGTDTVTFGKLNLIDLAGSERAAETENRGVRLREGANINRSLLALGNCINALATMEQKAKETPKPTFNLKPANSSTPPPTAIQQRFAIRKVEKKEEKRVQQAPHVPFRDSKLTRILKDSLGGNTRTLMIVNIAPSAKYYEETHNSLKYGARAKNIKKQKAIKNEVTKEQEIEELRKMVSELKSEIEKLRRGEREERSDPNQRLALTLTRNAYNLGETQLRRTSVKRGRDSRDAVIPMACCVQSKESLGIVSEALYACESAKLTGSSSSRPSLSDHRSSQLAQQKLILDATIAEIQRTLQTQAQSNQQAKMRIEQAFQAAQRNLDPTRNDVRQKSKLSQTSTDDKDRGGGREEEQKQIDFQLVLTGLSLMTSEIERAEEIKAKREKDWREAEKNKNRKKIDKSRSLRESQDNSANLSPRFIPNLAQSTLSNSSFLPQVSSHFHSLLALCPTNNPQNSLDRISKSLISAFVNGIEEEMQMRFEKERKKAERDRIVEEETKSQAILAQIKLINERQSQVWAGKGGKDEKERKKKELEMNKKIVQLFAQRQAKEKEIEEVDGELREIEGRLEELKTAIAEEVEVQTGMLERAAEVKESRLRFDIASLTTHNLRLHRLVDSLLLEKQVLLEGMGVLCGITSDDKGRSDDDQKTGWMKEARDIQASTNNQTEMEKLKGKEIPHFKSPFTDNTSHTPNHPSTLPFPSPFEIHNSSPLFSTPPHQPRLEEPLRRSVPNDGSKIGKPQSVSSVMRANEEETEREMAKEKEKQQPTSLFRDPKKKKEEERRVDPKAKPTVYPKQQVEIPTSQNNQNITQTDGREPLVFVNRSKGVFEGATALVQKGGSAERMVKNPVSEEQKKRDEPDTDTDTDKREVETQPRVAPLTHTLPDLPPTSIITTPVTSPASQVSPKPKPAFTPPKIKNSPNRELGIVRTGKPGQPPQRVNVSPLRGNTNQQSKIVPQKARIGEPRHDNSPSASPLTLSNAITITSSPKQAPSPSSLSIQPSSSKPPLHSTPSSLHSRSPITNPQNSTSFNSNSASLGGAFVVKGLSQFGQQQNQPTPAMPNAGRVGARQPLRTTPQRGPSSNSNNVQQQPIQPRFTAPQNRGPAFSRPSISPPSVRRLEPLSAVRTGGAPIVRKVNAKPANGVVGRSDDERKKEEERMKAEKDKETLSEQMDRINRMIAENQKALRRNRPEEG
ncbi:putative Kinesin heavy chain [Blattamonas nauphoetae]|uniref:Kinesin heavy chain n=1 Tax=Blattamonas nauphoetae TaxID=2049346 RepID=A0ABQ9XIV2_9EUKA|nr:putative Kinesin heavy chain [Blattamonas nauphoetae]